jgi:hypothetical protein
MCLLGPNNCAFPRKAGRRCVFYAGGAPKYRERCDEVAARGYRVFRPGPEATERHLGVNAWLPLLVSCFEEVRRAMRYLRIVLLLLAVTIGTQACYVAIGPDRGWHRHHEGGYEGR